MKDCLTFVTAVVVLDTNTKKCAVYRNQAKEDLLYGSWVQAQTTAEKWKQSRVRGKWNITLEDSNNGS